jgi:uncharacterized protein YggE
MTSPPSPAEDPGHKTPESPVVRALGEATVEAAPELAELCVTLEGRAKGHWETSESLTRRSEECVALIAAYGPAIEQMLTSELRISPELPGMGDKVRWYGGTVCTRFVVSDFSVLGELMSRLAQLRPVAVEGPRWRLRTDSPVHREALESAVRAAMARAAEYAQAAGGRLIRLLELADSALATGYRPAAQGATPGQNAGPVARPGSGSDWPTALELEPVTQTVRASVEARFVMTHPESLEISGA